MALFPKREADVEELAEEMLAGFVANPGLFPHADVAGLKADFDAYVAARADQVQKLALSHLATEAKYAALGALAVSMREQLRQAEVDAYSEPERLKYIGWRPRAHRAPVDPPAQAHNLRVRLLSPGKVLLTWRPPKGRTPGGPIRMYKVMRREQPRGGGAFTEWRDIDGSITPEITLEAQPKDLRFEYCVVAVNHGGRSLPSNTVVL